MVSGLRAWEYYWKLRTGTCPVQFQINNLSFTYYHCKSHTDGLSENEVRKHSQTLTNTRNHTQSHVNTHERSVAFSWDSVQPWWPRHTRRVDIAHTTLYTTHNSSRLAAHRRSTRARTRQRDAPAAERGVRDCSAKRTASSSGNVAGKAERVKTCSA